MGEVTDDTILIYTKHCLSCTDKAKWRQLKAFALNNHLKLEERRIGRKKDWAEQAEQYEIEPPFVVYKGTTISLGELASTGNFPSILT